MEGISSDLVNVIMDYIIFKPKTKEELQEAVNLWCENKEEALNKYSHISLWDTSLITDMSYLFENKEHFNDNINNWNVSNVTDMESMFSQALSFNQPLDSWDFSSVTNMNCMFSDIIF